MGHNAVKALAADADPRAVMVVMVGMGHVVYGLGAQRQAALWGNEPTASVVAMAAEEDGKPAMVRASLGDFIWGTPPDSKEPAFPSLGASLSDKPGVAGPTVGTVRAGSAAQKAGVLKGDVVVAVDGQSTADKEAVLLQVGTKAWGDRLGIDVMRGGQRHALTATLLRETPARAAPDAKGAR
jgi:S1-C subfamily serine protease